MKCESEARTILRKLASDARERLKNGNYGNVQKNNSIRQSIIIENNLRLITNECKKPQITIKIINDYNYDACFQKKVFNLLQENSDTICPLKNLVDETEFQILTETQKQRYILDLADKYTEVRKEYFDESVMAI